MTTDKPTVIVIRNKGNEISEGLAETTVKSWESKGYETELFDAITPDDLDKYNYLDFGDGILAHPTRLRPDDHPWAPIKFGSQEDNYSIRHMSGGEKAVYYSHLEVLKLIARRNVPHFVVEHDGELKDGVDPESLDCKDSLYIQISPMILRGGYWHPRMASAVLHFVHKFGLGLKQPRPRDFYTRCEYETVGLLNADGWMTQVLTYLCSVDKTKEREILKGVKFVSNIMTSFIKNRPHRRRLLKNFDPNLYDNILIGRKNTPGIIEHRNYKPLKKRTAVMVSGAYHEYLDHRDLEKTIWDILSMFKGCDVYWQTWDTPKQREIFNKVKQPIKVVFVPQPEGAHYNPHALLSKRFPNRTHKEWRRLGLKGIATKTTRAKRGEKDLSIPYQQLSFDLQWKYVPKGYDFYVRTRWDICTRGCSDYGMIEDMLELAEERVVGIGLQAGKRKYFKCNLSAIHKNDKHAHYKAIRKVRKTVRTHLEKGIYCLLDSPECDEVGIGVGQRWEGFLNDFAIIFKESDLEGVDIEQLYKSAELMPVEFGWHQIFCSKRSHYNVDGIFALRRNVDVRFTTYNRLMDNELI